MKLAVISPTEHLPAVESRVLAYHFALGQHLVNDSDYYQWYRRAQSRGQFVIVDNGAAEPKSEREDFWTIAECAMDMDVDEIVLPDKLMDATKTLEMSLDSAVLNYIPPRKRMVVPQGGNWSEWTSCLLTLVAHAEPASIGVPKWLEAWRGGRPKALSIILKHGLEKYHHIHLLGIHSKPFEEVTDALRAYPGIRGLDTAAPIAYAQNVGLLTDEEHYSIDWEGPGIAYSMLTANIRTYRDFMYQVKWDLAMESR